VTPLAQARLAIARQVWWDAHGLPYRWGGDTYSEGFDCSGLVIEGLQACGILPRDGDWRAADLAARFPVAPTPQPGCLLFWGTPITHVEIAWEILPDGSVLTLGASGGGSATTTREAAEQQAAYVKVRPARAGVVRVVNPFADRVVAGDRRSLT
jgi:hypothetical protein